jgi:hypothetical protein
MDQQSILAHTLTLFGGAFAAALFTLGVVVWGFSRRRRSAAI